MSSSLVLPALLLQATLSYALPVSNPWGGGGFFSFHGSPVAGEDDSTSVAATETATSTIPTPAPDAPSTTAQGNSGRDDVNNAAAVTPDAGADSGSASTKAEHKSSSTSLKTRSSSTSSASASSTDSHSSDVARFQTALLNSASSTINSVPQNSTLPVANITTNNNSDGGLNRTGLAAGITIPIVVLLLVFGTMAYFRIRWRRVNAKGGRVLPSEKGREREIDPESQLTTANSGMGLISGTVTTTTTSGLGTGTVGTVQSVKSRLSFSSLLLLLNANANANREEPPTAAATATSPDAATSPSPRIRTPQAQTPSIRSRFSFSSLLLLASNRAETMTTPAPASDADGVRPGAQSRNTLYSGGGKDGNRSDLQLGGGGGVVGDRDSIAKSTLSDSLPGPETIIDISIGPTMGLGLELDDDPFSANPPSTPTPKMVLRDLPPLLPRAGTPTLPAFPVTALPQDHPPSPARPRANSNPTPVPKPLVSRFSGHTIATPAVERDADAESLYAAAARRRPDAESLYSVSTALAEAGSVKRTTVSSERFSSWGYNRLAGPVGWRTNHDITVPPLPPMPTQMQDFGFGGASRPGYGHRRGYSSAMQSTASASTAVDDGVLGLEREAFPFPGMRRYASQSDMTIYAESQSRRVSIAPTVATFATSDDGPSFNRSRASVAPPMSILSSARSIDSAAYSDMRHISNEAALAFESLTRSRVLGQDEPALAEAASRRGTKIVNTVRPRPLPVAPVPVPALPTAVRPATPMF